MRPKIVLHDVLQAAPFSYMQTKYMGDISPFVWFQETIKKLGGFEIKLAVITNGINVYPEWVDMIRLGGWEVQLHGLVHHDMQHLSPNEVFNELKEAKEILENTFEQKVTQFYPPRLKVSPHIYDACRKLNLDLMMNNYTLDHYMFNKNIPEFYMHYWSKRQIGLLDKL